MNKIGILCIATGKYDIFIPPLYHSVMKHFFVEDEVTMFVFTDSENIPEENNIVRVFQEHSPWPGSTLFRYHIFDKNKEVLSKMDYLFYCDADMRFVAPVGREILPDLNSNGLVGTEHPGFYGGRRGTYETRPESKAYVAPNEGKIYFAGGFNGGTSEAFLKMSNHLKNEINIDLSNGITPIFHDESMMNKFFLYNCPKILSPSYCFPESWHYLPFEKKLLALDKNHAEIRN